MKKIYAILLTSFLSFPIFANNQIENQKLTFGEVYRDGVEAVSTVYQDSKDVINNIAPEVKQALIDIAKALGVAVEHVYIVLVKKFVVLNDIDKELKRRNTYQGKLIEKDS